VEAQIALAEINLGREKALRAENMNSQSDLDTVEASVKQLKANADAIRATIAKKTVRAPFAGRLGLRQVNLGQFLDAGKAIVGLQSLEPVHVDFSLPQAELSRLTVGMKVVLQTDAYPGRKFEGLLTAITPEVDSSTRSITLQATFENKDQTLRPGMYAKVEVLMPKEDTVMVIPLTAVLSAPYGDSVFVIEPSTNNVLTARQQFIRSGRTRGDFQTVESGLKVGQRIASAGLFKLRNGVQVVENNEMVPKNEADPHPDER
jgi:membrane fusion protein (multidrug efflux system)